MPDAQYIQLICYLGGGDFMVDTAFGELPTPLVASMADASSNTGSNQHMNTGSQTGMFPLINKLHRHIFIHLS